MDTDWSVSVYLYLVFVKSFIWSCGRTSSRMDCLSAARQWTCLMTYLKTLFKDAEDILQGYIQERLGSSLKYENHTDDGMVL